MAGSDFPEPPHSIDAQTDRATLQRAFVQDAKAAAAEIDAGAPVYAMADVAAYLRARVAGGTAERPKPV